jgi:hypothetical protein
MFESLAEPSTKPVRGEGPPDSRQGLGLRSRSAVHGGPNRSPLLQVADGGYTPGAAGNHRMRLTLSGFAGLFLGRIVIGGVVIAAPGPGMPAHQPESRTIYVTAIDRDGRPVTDLQAADFALKVGNKPLEVVRADPAQMPLRIAVLVSDAGIGGFQQALGHFMQKLLGRAEFSLISVIVQPEVIVDYASEGAPLRDGLRRLGPRGRQAGAQLMEAIREAAGTVRRGGRRPAILVLRVGSEATSPLSGNEVREQLRTSGALLHVVSTLGAQRTPASSARPGISNEQAQMQDNDTANSNLNLAQVLGDGARESGGRHDQVVSTTLVPALERVADELLNQYAITCALPQGLKPTDKLSVSTTRKGLKVQAPARLPTP